MPYREKVDLLRVITQELDQIHAPANGRSVERRSGAQEVMEVHEAGCATATPEPVPEPAPSTEIVR
jgi:hypothetical protein